MRKRDCSVQWKQLKCSVRCQDEKVKKHSMLVRPQHEVPQAENRTTAQRTKRRQKRRRKTDCIKRRRDSKKRRRRMKMLHIKRWQLSGCDWRYTVNPHRNVSTDACESVYVRELLSLEGDTGSPFQIGTF